jgi:hypothetical protein
MPGCRPLDAEIDRRYARVEPQVITFIDPNLAERTTAVLQMVAGKGPVVQVPVVTGAKDSSFYQGKIPGLDFFLGVTPEGQTPIRPRCAVCCIHTRMSVGWSWGRALRRRGPGGAEATRNLL